MTMDCMRAIPDLVHLHSVRRTQGFFGQRRHLHWQGMSSLLVGNDGERPARMHWWYDGDLDSTFGFSFQDPKPWLPLNVAGENFESYWRVRPAFVFDCSLVRSDHTFQHWADGEQWPVQPPTNITGVRTAYAGWSEFGALVVVGTDGVMQAWGVPDFGGTPPVLDDVVAVACTNGVMSGMTGGGAVHTWGVGFADSPQPYIQDAKVLADASNVYFAAIREDDSLAAWSVAADSKRESVDWGPAAKLPAVLAARLKSGTSVPIQLDSVVAVTGGVVGWAALHVDKRVTISGYPDAEIPEWVDVESLLSGAAVLASIDHAGNARSAGDAFFGGGSETSNAASLAATHFAIAVLLRDGTVNAWGPVQDPEDPFALYVPSATVPDGLANVITLAATRHAFAALQADGKVTTWGIENLGHVPEGRENVAAIYSYCNGFVAVYRDGSAEAWGSAFPADDVMNSWTNRLPYLDFDV